MISPSDRGERMDDVINKSYFSFTLHSLANLNGHHQRSADLS